MSNETGYNGWKNWETWNAALWMMNEEDTYHTARSCAEKCRRFGLPSPYALFIGRMERRGDERNGDGLLWRDSRIARREVSAAMYELIEE